MQPNLNIPIQDQTKLFDETKLKLGPNVAEGVVQNSRLQNDIWQYMLKEYIYPQLMARRPYEKMWDMLYDAYRCRLKITSLQLKEDELKFLQTLLDRAAGQGNQDLVLSDSLIFDTVNSLSNLAHYVSWKDGKPVQFGSPEDFVNAMWDMFYSPDEAKYRSANSVLSWSLAKEDAMRKFRDACRDYFLYGFGYMFSDLYFRADIDPETQGVVLKDIGMSYVPLSIRNVYIDWRVPISDMKSQPCPFWFEMTPMFNILANPYEPSLNPMGFQNLDKVGDVVNYSNWFMGGESWIQAINARLESIGFQSVTGDVSMYTKVAAKWTFLPMLPFDSKTGEFLKRKDGSLIPFRRYILTAYGADVISGKICFLRLQDVHDHYDTLMPIYGGTHLGDLSSSAYSMSVCEVVIKSALQISELYNHALENKKLINQPPVTILTGSPAENSDPNKPNEKIPVSGPQDFTWRTVPDATQSTQMMAQSLRFDAQKTTHVTESILGQALGGRTTATEADNLYETSMSQITTEITLLNDAYHGGYGERVWKMYGQWLDPDLTKLITGQYGWPLSNVDLALRISLRTDVGTKFLTGKLKTNILREMLQVAVQSPFLDQAILWQEFTKAVGLPGLQRAIIDGGRDRQIQIATNQAMQIYLNKPSILNPEQDHTIALQVKTRFLEDVDSEWNVEYGDMPYMFLSVPVTRKQALAAQIQLHQNYIIMQEMQKQQMLTMQAANLIQAQSAALQLKQKPETQSK